MPPRCPIPLYPQPPFSPCQTPQVDSASDGSDFPPIRIAATRMYSLDPPTHPLTHPYSATSSAGRDPQVDSASDGSDFPPIRIAVTRTYTLCFATHPHLYPASHDRSSPELQSPLQRSRLPTYKGRRLGHTNILNTMHGTVQQPNHKVRHQNMSMAGYELLIN